jgi:hypothetical protein
LAESADLWTDQPTETTQSRNAVYLAASKLRKVNMEGHLRLRDEPGGDIDQTNGDEIIEDEPGRH